MAADELKVIGMITLPGVARSVRSAREFVRDMAPLGYSGVPDLELAVAELAGNAIRHTETGKGGWFTLMLCQADDRLVIEVTDDGADGARPVMVIGPEPEFPEEGGRGLCLVDALAVRWGYWENGSRTTVFAEFPHR